MERIRKMELKVGTSKGASTEGRAWEPNEVEEKCKDSSVEVNLSIKLYIH